MIAVLAALVIATPPTAPKPLPEDPLVVLVAPAALDVALEKGGAAPPTFRQTVGAFLKGVGLVSKQGVPLVARYTRAAGLAVTPGGRAPTSHDALLARILGDSPPLALVVPASLIGSELFGQGGRLGLGIHPQKGVVMVAATHAQGRKAIAAKLQEALKQVRLTEKAHPDMASALASVTIEEDDARLTVTAKGPYAAFVATDATLRAAISMVPRPASTP